LATHRPIRDLLDELLTIEARMGALGARGAALRVALAERAEQVKQADGVAPTWRVPGLGMVAYRDPQPKVGVVDPDAFGSWAAQHYPTEVTGVIRLGAAHLPAALEVIREAATAGRFGHAEHVEAAATLEIREPWRRTFLDRCAADGGLVLAPDTGQIVDGAGLVPGGSAGVTVRLDPEAKARAAATVDPPLLAAGIPGAGDDEAPDPAEGEPDYGPPHAARGIRPPTPPANLDRMIVGQLRLECRKLELDDRGRKPALLARLREFYGLAVPA
jgi:hypothetical protein